MGNLSPEFFDCPALCSGPQADQKNGCPDCEYTKLYNFFVGQAEELLKKELGGAEAKKYSVKSLYGDVLSIFSLDNELRGRGYPRNCSAITAACLNVVRVQVNKKKRIDHWRRQQKMKNKDA